MKKGILMVSFGTTFKETREKNIHRLAEKIKNKYKNINLYQAYSSDIVRKVLKQRDGIYVMDIKEAFEKMKQDGVESVKVLPTHIIDGIENNKLKDIAKECEKYFSDLKIAAPLLETKEDYYNTANALWNELKDETGNGLLVLMGHGSQHEADSSYEKLENILQKISGGKSYIATVEGSTSIEQVIEKIKLKSPDCEKNVVLAPFMLVAGDHAINDMAGDEEDSFAIKMKAAGFKPKCLLKGIGEYSGICDIYMEHLNDVM